jgi:hypothetical protein
VVGHIAVAGAHTPVVEILEVEDLVVAIVLESSPNPDWPVVDPVPAADSAAAVLELVLRYG